MSSSSKKQRRVEALLDQITEPTVSTRTPFQVLMDHLKFVGYQRLHEEYQRLVNYLLTISNPTDLLRRGVNEYLRGAHLIDLSYDSTKHYCGKVIGMGNSECSVLFPMSDDNDDKKLLSNILPTFIPSLKVVDVRAVSAGGQHSLVLSTNGIPYSWGNNDKGALGRIISESEMENIKDPEVVPSPVTGFYTSSPNQQDSICEDGQIIQISAGENHSLFLSIQGNVYQCGCYLDKESNTFRVVSERDVGSDTKQSVFGFQKKPMHLHQLPKKAIAISAGCHISAALLEDYTLYTWGINTLGALARIGEGIFEGKTSYEELVTDAEGKLVKKMHDDILEEHFLRPKPVMFAHSPLIPPKVIAVACGLYHIVAIARDQESSQGKLYTSGFNSRGNLGHGDTDDRHKLTLVEDKKDEDFGYVAAGDMFSLALTHDRKVLYSFGRSDYGQLGLGYDGKLADIFTTPQVVRFTDPVDIVSIDVGDRHASLITSENELYTWGFNEVGATGHPDISAKVDGFADIYRPKLLKLEMGAEWCPVQFSGGGQHSLLLVRPKLAN